MLGRPSLSLAVVPSQRTAVGAEEIDVPPHDLVEVRAAHLLLALDDPPDSDGQTRPPLAERPDDCKPDRQLALVVGCTSRKEVTPAQRGLERWRLP
jgi:hypothetical protein